jgi:hypothetical protein
VPGDERDYYSSTAPGVRTLSMRTVSDPVLKVEPRSPRTWPHCLVKLLRRVLSDRPVVSDGFDKEAAVRASWAAAAAAAPGGLRTSADDRPTSLGAGRPDDRRPLRRCPVEGADVPAGSGRPFIASSDAAIIKLEFRL